MTQNFKTLIKEIVYLEADTNYTIFHLKNGRKIVSSFTLKKYANNPDFSHFLRINRHSLINPDFIKSFSYTRKVYSVFLTNNLQVVVSRRRVKDTLNKIVNIDIFSEKIQNSIFRKAGFMFSRDLNYKNELLINSY